MTTDSTTIMQMAIAVRHLALEVPAAVHDDVAAKWFAVEAEIATLRAAIPLLREARAEIDKWGYGDFHWGDTPRDEGVLAALAKIDAFLASVSSEGSG